MLYELSGWQFTEAKRLAVAQAQVEHLIKIAVVQKSIPGYADQVPTHQAIERSGIEGGG